MTTKALITKIIDFSFVDGPGNRITIFMQGCNFNCGYCHNPQTINPCKNCGICVSHCPASALEIRGRKVVYDESKCMDCDKCIAACKNFSTPKAREMTVEQIFERIESVKDFVQGITVSGGECTLQWTFIKELFKGVTSKSHLTTFIDTNGNMGDDARKNLLPYTHGFMLDVKAVLSETHKIITGVGNEQVINNLFEIHRVGKLYEVRYVVVPSINDSTSEIEELGKLIAKLDPTQRLVLIPFRNFGVKGKFKNLEEPTEEKMEKIKSTLLNIGLENVILKNS